MADIPMFRPCTLHVPMACSMLPGHRSCNVISSFNGMLCSMLRSTSPSWQQSRKPVPPTEVMSLGEGPGRLLVWFDQAGITFDRSAAAIKTDLETSYGVYALQDVSKGQVLCR